MLWRSLEVWFCNVNDGYSALLLEISAIMVTVADAVMGVILRLMTLLLFTNCIKMVFIDLLDAVLLVDQIS